MKNRFLLLIALALSACNSETPEENSIVEDSVVVINDELKEHEEIPEPLGWTPKNNLAIPEGKDYDLRIMKIEKVREYGAGDCFGTATRYAMKDVRLVVDTLSCGEYGYTNVHYLMDSTDAIRVVHKFEYWSVMPTPVSDYIHITEEKIYNFTDQPPTVRQRRDTIEENVAEIYMKPLELQTIEDAKGSLDHWKSEYRKIWDREFTY